MRLLLQILGVAAFLVGLLWLGQGIGLIRWPASSFMIGMQPWAIRGVVLMAVGVGLLAWSRHR